MTKNEFELIVKNSISRNDVAKKLGYTYYNGRVGKIINELILTWGVDISHFILSGQPSKYKKIIKICPVCKKNFEEKSGCPKEKTYCSQRCSNSDRTHTEETKEKLRKITTEWHSKNKKERKINLKILNCKNCGREKYIKYKRSDFCSISCSVQWRVKNGLHTGWKVRNKQPSYAEKYFIEVLNNINIKYERDLKVDKYFVDFAIKDKMIALEIDGKQHSNLDRIESDRKKDATLLNLGWRVIRIKWYNPINDKNKQKLYEQINNFKNILNNT